MPQGSLARVDSSPGVTPGVGTRSRGQEERHLAGTPHLAQPPMGQEPMHGFTDMPLAEPAPGGWRVVHLTGAEGPTPDRVQEYQPR